MTASDVMYVQSSFVRAVEFGSAGSTAALSILLVCRRVVRWLRALHSDGQTDRGV